MFPNATCHPVHTGGNPNKSCIFRTTYPLVTGEVLFSLAWVEEMPQQAVDRWLPAAGSRALRAGFTRGSRAGVVVVNEAGRQMLLEAALVQVQEVVAKAKTAVAFRDRVLMKSPRGKQIVKAYNQNRAAIARAATSPDDESLFHDFDALWQKSEPFIRAMIVAADGGSPSSVRFTQRRYEEVRAIIGRFRAVAETARLKTVLDEVERDLAPFAGLSARAAVDKLVATR